MRQIMLFLLLCAGALAQAPAQRQFLIRIEPARNDFSLQTVTDAERPVLAKHGAYLKSLADDDKLVIAGQVFDPNGLWGIVIVKAADLEAARAILEADPAIQQKVFRGTVAPYRTVFSGSGAGK